MKQRFLAAILTMAMLLCLLPSMALADGNQLYIGGINCSSEGVAYWRTNTDGTLGEGNAGNYNIKFDPTQTPATLTLSDGIVNNANNIDGSSGLDFDCGIYFSGGPLNIHLKGGNTVTAVSTGGQCFAIRAGGNLTITAEKGASLTASASGGSIVNCGISAAGGLAIGGGKVIAKGSTLAIDKAPSLNYGEGNYEYKVSADLTVIPAAYTKGKTTPYAHSDSYKYLEFRPAMAQYTVTYNTGTSATVSAVTVEEGGSFTAAAAVSSDGYNFAGWKASWNNTT